MKKKAQNFDKESKTQCDTVYTTEKSDDEEDKPFLGATALSLSLHEPTYLKRCSSEHRTQLKHIEQQYKSVNGIYSDISTLVSEQSQGIIMMDDKLKNVVKLHKNSNQHLNEALKMQGSEWSLGVKVGLFLMLIIIFIVMLMVL